MRLPSKSELSARAFDPTGHLSAQFPELERLFGPSVPRRTWAAVRRPDLRWPSLEQPSPDLEGSLRLARYLKAHYLVRALRDPGTWTTRLLVTSTFLVHLRERRMRAAALENRGPWAALSM